MPTPFHRTISNELHELESLMHASTNFLEDQGISHQAVYRINLALEEMITNIIRHGYDDYDEHKIVVSIEVRENELAARIEDDGHAFNPLESEKTGAVGSLDDPKVGGVGIHLIRKLIDQVTYKRENEKNILELTMRRDFPPDAK
jgi:anti-sigma regulatory factor (Ser/Thr protein kinase)